MTEQNTDLQKKKNYFFKVSEKIVENKKLQIFFVRKDIIRLSVNITREKKFML